MENELKMKETVGLGRVDTKSEIAMQISKMLQGFFKTGSAKH